MSHPSVRMIHDPRRSGPRTKELDVWFQIRLSPQEVLYPIVGCVTYTTNLSWKKDEGAH